MSDINIFSQVQTVSINLTDVAAKNLKHCVKSKRLKKKLKNSWLYSFLGRALT